MTNGWIRLPQCRARLLRGRARPPPPPDRYRQKARTPSGTDFWWVSIIIQGQKRNARVGRHHERCRSGRSLCPYGRRIGADTIKSLKSTGIRLYTRAAASLLSISPEEMPRLAKELEEDPLIHNFLQNIGCELYHRFGMYLAPLAAATITAEHCDWNSDAGRSSAPPIINGATELDCGPQVNTDDQ
jgi:hypothetical protein